MKSTRIKTDKVTDSTLLLGFLENLLEDNQYFDIQSLNLAGATKNYRREVLYVNDSYLYCRFLMLFLANAGYETYRIFTNQEEVGSISICNNVIEISEASRFLNDFKNNTNHIRDTWVKSFNELKKVINGLASVRKINRIFYLNEDGAVLQLTFDHAGYQGEHMPVLNLKEFYLDKADGNEIAKFILNGAMIQERHFIQSIDHALAFQNRLKQFPQLFQSEINEDLIMTVKSAIVAHHWHNDIKCEYDEADKTVCVNQFHVRRADKLGIFDNDEALLSDLTNYQNTFVKCNTLFEIAKRHKFNAKIRKTAQGTIVLAIRDLSETFLAAFKNASTPITAIFSPIVLNSFSINMSQAISEESWQLFMSEVEKNFKIIEMVNKLKTEFKDKSHQFITEYTGKTEHNIDDYLRLGYEKLAEIYNEIKKQVEQDKIYVKTVSENLKLLRQSLKRMLNIDNVIESNDYFTIPLHQTGTFQASRFSGMLASFNIPGMIVHKDRVLIMKDSLATISKDFLINLEDRSEKFITCVTVLDTVICNLRDPSILEPNSKREDEHGFVFAFRDEEARLKFPAHDLLEECPTVARLYRIPYSSCLDAVGLIGKLKAAIATVLIKKQNDNQRVNDVKVANESTYTGHGLAPAKPVNNEKSGHNKIQKKSKTQKKPKANTSNTVTKSLPSTSKSGMFKYTNTSLGKQPSQRGAPLNVADNDYVTVDLSKLHPEQAAMAEPVAMEVHASNDKPIKRHKYAHEGAIEFELTFLECGLAWHKQLEHKDDKFNKIFAYGGWLSEVRLFDAINSRVIALPDCTPLSVNDKEAAGVRVKLLHENPSPVFVNKLREHLVESKLRLKLRDVFTGKAQPGNESFDFYLRANFVADERSTRDLIKDTFNDLCDFINHFDDKIKEDAKREGEIYKILTSDLVSNITDLLVFEARAIHAAIVLLGALYRQADPVFIEEQYGKSVKQFMQLCVADRNVAAHNSVFNATFDPTCLPVILEQARKGASLWKNRDEELREIDRYEVGSRLR